ncbi:MAG TPA: hypothetical protein PKC14_02240 [Candidatus Absconditabacterales bacterium]|nr:hypothetical protein [Candidatus Absconditabacterales bacterium]
MNQDKKFLLGCVLVGFIFVQHVFALEFFQPDVWMNEQYEKVNQDNTTAGLPSSAEIGGIYNAAYKMLVETNLRSNKEAFSAAYQYINAQYQCSMTESEVASVLYFIPDIRNQVNRLLGPFGADTKTTKAGSMEGFIASCTKFSQCLQKNGYISDQVSLTPLPTQNFYSSQSYLNCTNLMKSAYYLSEAAYYSHHKIEQSSRGTDIFSNASLEDSSYDLMIDIQNIGSLLFGNNKKVDEIVFFQMPRPGAIGQAFGGLQGIGGGAIFQNQALDSLTTVFVPWQGYPPLTGNSLQSGAHLLTGLILSTGTISLGSGILTLSSGIVSPSVSNPQGVLINNVCVDQSAFPLQQNILNDLENEKDDYYNSLNSSNLTNILNDILPAIGTQQVSQTADCQGPRIEDSIQKSRSLVQAGELVSFQISYANKGLGNARNTAVAFTFPQDIIFVSESHSLDVLSYVGSGNTYQWRLQTLAAGASGFVVITGRALQKVDLSFLPLIAKVTTDSSECCTRKATESFSGLILSQKDLLCETTDLVRTTDDFLNAAFDPQLTAPGGAVDMCVQKCDADYPINGYNSLLNNSVCKAQCLCQTIGDTSDPFWMRFCFVPGQSRPIVPGKQLVNIEEIVDEINSILIALKNSGQLLKSKKTKEILETSMQKIKLNKVFHFDFIVKFKPIFNQKNKKTQQNKNTATENKLSQGILQNEGSLNSKSERNKYLIIGLPGASDAGFKDAPTVEAYNQNLATLKNYVGNKPPYDLENAKNLLQKSISIGVQDEFYVFFEQNRNYRVQLQDVLKNIKDTAESLDKKIQSSAK